MSKLYLRLPSSAAAEAASPRGLVCSYALVTNGKAEREGVAALSELSATVAKVQCVVLLLAASDVTLLRLQVPPLSAPRLRIALPNLVEDHIIGDPAECAIAAGASEQGMRTVAVVQRSWLETVTKAIAAYGARKIIIVPAQLCLSWSPHAVSAAVELRADELQVTVRLSEHEGFGVAMSSASSAQDVLDTVSAVARDGPFVLHVPDAMANAYRDAIAAVPALAARARVGAESWSCWLDGAQSAGLDLLSDPDVRRAGQEHRFRQWRWPIALAAAVLVVNVAGLAMDWWRLKSESDHLRSAMVQTFRSTYPTESVILDPIAQMKQKIAASRRASGQVAPDDFLVQLSGFAQAWKSLTRSPSDPKSAQIAAIEFRDHSLLVRAQADAAIPEDKLSDELKQRGLSLSHSSANTWQTRSLK